MEHAARDSPGWVLYYDGDCGFCVHVVRALSRLDLFARVTWTAYQALAEPPNGLSWEDLSCAAYLDNGRGRLYRGFYAFRILTLRLIPLAPLAPILWFPGVNLLGVAAYRWVATNRHRLSHCRMPGLSAGQGEKPLGKSDIDPHDLSTR